MAMVCPHVFSHLKPWKAFTRIFSLCVKMMKLLLYNVTTIIILLICYISLFGWKSLEKYLKKDVFIITEEESLPSISPPGLNRLAYTYKYCLSCFSSTSRNFWSIVMKQIGSVMKNVFYCSRYKVASVRLFLQIE